MHKFDPSLSADKAQIMTLYDNFKEQVANLKTERDNLKTAWNDPNDTNCINTLKALDDYVEEVDNKTKLIEEETRSNIAALSSALKDISAGQ